MNYAENDYFRNALSKGAPRGSGPRMPKMPQLQDFQFFDSGRITELNAKQYAYEVYLHNKKKEKGDGESKVKFLLILSSNQLHDMTCS